MQGRAGLSRLGREQGRVPLGRREAWGGQGSVLASASLGGQVGAIGQRGQSVCSGLVAPETPGLGIKPEEEQILLPKHKRSHIK